MDVFDVEQAYIERSLMRQLGVHPNILTCQTFYEDSSFVCNVTELMDFDLRDIVSKFKSPMKEDYVR